MRKVIGAAAVALLAMSANANAEIGKETLINIYRAAAETGMYASQCEKITGRMPRWVSKKVIEAANVAGIDLNDPTHKMIFEMVVINEAKRFKLLGARDYCEGIAETWTTSR